ncbi:MAG: YraN family protein [Clostridiaceae bacterium]|jgi:putative endonuclease|nr:YraN family protein [Clostridiaceae bacterium]
MKASLVGRRGEAQAADYLRRRGYRIIEAGYRSRYGEIDLIAEKRGIVAIVEVKTRSGDRFAQALEAVDGPKRRRIRLTALQWLAQQEREPQLRFDVIEVYPGGKINHIENAFE